MNDSLQGMRVALAVVILFIISNYGALSNSVV